VFFELEMEKTEGQRPYRGIEVIGAGWGRTGTNSLMKALEILGYDPCYHMEKVIKDGAGDIWANVYQGKPYDFDDIFGPKKYRATCDFPSCIYWKEQLQKYPHAKVILSTRDPNKWHKSCMDTIFKAMPGNPFSPFGLKICHFFNLGPIGKLSREIVTRIFHNRTSDRDYTTKLFTDYNERVIAECPKDKLLVFQVEQGWEPLCNFLGCPIPDVPFPRVNDTAQFQQHLVGINRIGYQVLGAILLLTAGTIFGISKLLSISQDPVGEL
jgi:hypothetical protein